MNRFIKKIMLFSIFLLVLLAGNNVLAKTTTVGTCEYTSYNLGAKDFYLKMNVVQYNNNSYQLVLQDDSFYFDDKLKKTVKMQAAVSTKKLVWNTSKLKNSASTSNLLSMKTSTCPEAVAHVEKDNKLYIFFGAQNDLKTVVIGGTDYNVESIGGQVTLELKKEQEAKNNEETIANYKQTLGNSIDKLNSLSDEFINNKCDSLTKNINDVSLSDDEIKACGEKLTEIKRRTNELKTDVTDFKKLFPNEDSSSYESALKKFQKLVNSSDSSKSNEPDSSSYIDDGEEFTDETICEVVPPEIKKWIVNILKIVRYIALALVIVLGALDFMKAAGSGEPDQMKKAGQSFLKRVIAVAVLFLLPYIVELVLGLIDMFGVNTNCMDPGSI